MAMPNIYDTILNILYAILLMYLQLVAVGEYMILEDDHFLVLQSRTEAASMFGEGSPPEDEDPGSGRGDGSSGPGNGHTNPVHHPQPV